MQIKKQQLTVASIINVTETEGFSHSLQQKHVYKFLWMLISRTCLILLSFLKMKTMHLEINVTSYYVHLGPWKNAIGPGKVL